ncbi:MAG: TetR/AcrR family transcriptional regulator [Desulfovibrio sp.]|uniref:TetR/AcrR family transcriptional regulator n=1 Tax=Desulfovibrio sp. 7SRBS1 TaxID=3378064 RepID=UPI003B3C305A
MESANKKRGRPRTMSDEQRRVCIVDVAEQLFVRKGYGGTSTGEIAGRCRISKQTLYRIFPGKLQLFIAVVEAHRMRMMDLGNGYDDLPIEEALAKVFMIDLDQKAYQLRAAFLRALNMEAASSPELRRILRLHGGEANRAELTAWLERQCRRRNLVIHDVDSAAHLLMDMFTGSIIWDALGGFGWPSREARIEHFRQCIQIFLHGVLPMEGSAGPSDGKAEH